MAGENKRKITGEEATVKEKRRRKKSGGLGGAAIAGVLVALSALGLMFSYKYYQNYLAEKAKIEEENRKNRIASDNGDTYVIEQGSKTRYGEGGTAVEQATQTPKSAPPAPAATVAVVREPSAEFTQLFDLAKQQFFDAQFGAAGETYGKAATAVAPDKELTSAKNAVEACALFAELTKDVTADPESDATGLMVIKLKNGSTMQAKVLSESANEVRYSKSGGMGGSLPRSVIDSMTPVSKEECDRQRAEKLAKIRAKAANDNDSLAYYLAALEALKANFRKESAEMLKTAYDMEKKAGGNLATTVREHKAWLIYRKGNYFYSLGIPERGKTYFDMVLAQYGDTKVADSARETLEQIRNKEVAVIENKRRIEAMEKVAAEERRKAAARAETERNSAGETKNAAESESDTGPAGGMGGMPLASDSGDKVSGKDQESISKGDELFSKGSKLYDDAMSVESAKKSNNLYKEAEKYFVDAMKYYEKAQKNDKNNASLNDRIQECGVKLFWTRKSMRVNI